MLEDVIFGDVAAGVLIALVLGIGGVIMGFFRKISRTHPELKTEWEGIVKELLDTDYPSKV